MESYNKLWRFFFAISLIAIAVQQLICKGFRPVILPPWPLWLSANHILVWIGSIFIILACTAIIFNIRGRVVAVYLAGTFLAMLILFHIPYQIKTNLHFFAGWSDAFKLLAYCGGALVVTASITKTEFPDGDIVSMLEKLLPAGRFFFAAMLIAFGAEHFIYIDFVIPMVPAWIPGQVFWAYFGGVALIAAGIAIVLNVQVRLAAGLIGLAIFLWTFMLHLPRAIADPHSGNGNEWTSVFEALGFSGIAFLIASNSKSKA